MANCPSNEGRRLVFCDRLAMYNMLYTILYRIMYTEDMAKRVPFSRARAELSELLDEVELRHEHVEITRNGRPAGVLMSSEEYEVIQETLEILDDAQTLEALRESEADVRARRLHALDEVRRELGLA